MKQMFLEGVFLSSLQDCSHVCKPFNSITSTFNIFEKQVKLLKKPGLHYLEALEVATNALGRTACYATKNRTQTRVWPGLTYRGNLR